MSGIVERLKDIKPPVEVPDHSAWIAAALVAVLLLLIAAAIYLLFIKRPKRRRRDPAAEAIERLKEIDFGDTKGAVYTFDEYFPAAAKNREDLMEEFRALFKDLERYKYKKEVPPLSRRDIERIKELIERVVS